MPSRHAGRRASPYRFGAGGALAALCAVATVHGLSSLEPESEPEPEDVAVSAELGGLHEVLRTPRGPVHVYQPRGYDPATAGVVLYVHGYYTDLAAACRRHHLVAQFAASGRNALFIAPEAPKRWTEPVRWEDLDALLETVAGHPDFTLPSGPRVALAHSGGSRTVEQWLDSDALDGVVLLDGLYGGEAALSRWLERRGTRESSLVLVGDDTLARVERFAARYPDARVLDGIRALGLTTPRGGERIVVVRSDIGHMELVTQQQAIPSVLVLTSLPPLIAEGQP